MKTLPASRTTKTIYKAGRYNEDEIVQVAEKLTAKLHHYRAFDSARQDLKSEPTTMTAGTPTTTTTIN
jgi:hypothetical protein